MTKQQLSLLVDPAQTAAENAARLTALTVATPHPHAWTYSELITVVGADAVRALRSLVLSSSDPIISACDIALASVGIDLSTARAQEMIGSLVVPDEQQPILDAIKSLGVTYSAIDPDATEEACAVALAYRYNEVVRGGQINTLLESLAAQYTDAFNQISELRNNSEVVPVSVTVTVG